MLLILYVWTVGLLVLLSDQQSKTQEHSTCNHIRDKQQILTIENHESATATSWNQSSFYFFCILHARNNAYMTEHQITDSLGLVNNVIKTVISNFLTFPEYSVSVTFWGILWFYGHEWLYMLISTLRILITTTFFYLCWCPPKEWCSHFYTLQKKINSNAFQLIFFDWWNSKMVYIFSSLIENHPFVY